MDDPFIQIAWRLFEVPKWNLKVEVTFCDLKISSILIFQNGRASLKAQIKICHIIFHGL
jgi:hypothetical protein